jgi:hypothetical protein
VNKKLVIVLALLVLLTIPFLTGLLKKDSRNEHSFHDCQSNPNPEFTSDFTDLAKVKMIVPPGSIQEWQGEKILKTHSYIVVKEKSPVYAPTDSVLYEGAYYQEEGMNQYSIFFQVSCEVFYIFDHIQEPVEKIKKAFKHQPKKDTRTEQIDPPINIKEGELIGYTTGTKYAHHFDFGVYNKTINNEFKEQNLPKLFGRDIWALCPFDYFPEEKRINYYSLFGNLKTDKPIPTLFCKPYR